MDKNMIKMGPFSIEDSIYNNTNITPHKYVKNSRCVLGFKTKRLIIENGIKYKDAIGISINTRDKSVEIGRDNNNIINFKINATFDLIEITKEGMNIIVSVK